MRIAVFRSNGKKFAEFMSLLEASRILNIPESHIASCIVGKTKTARALSGRRRKLGSFYFREIDSEKNHSPVGVG